MPWEVVIKKPDEEPLGSRDKVIAFISTAAPSIQWIEEPALVDQIRDMLNHPFHTLLPTWDESTRAHMSTSHLLGFLVDGQLRIEFFGFENDPIRWINLNVRGNGNPIGVLAAICIPNAWIAVDFCANKQIDLASGDAAGWSTFQEFRDDAIQRSRDEAKNRQGEFDYER